MLLYEQANRLLDGHLLYNHPFGRAETTNEFVPKVSVGDKDPQIEGGITPLFDASGLSQRQPDLTSAGLQSNKTARRKKTTWKKIAQKYKNEKKVRHDTSKYEVITDIKELESSVRCCELRDSGELQRGDGGPDQGALTDRTPCLICASNTVHFYDEGNEICADCYPQECQHCGSLNLCSKHAFGDGDGLLVAETVTMITSTSTSKQVRPE